MKRVLKAGKDQANRVHGNCEQNQQQRELRNPAIVAGDDISTGNDREEAPRGTSGRAIDGEGHP